MEGQFDLIFTCLKVSYRTGTRNSTQQVFVEPPFPPPLIPAARIPQHTKLQKQQNPIEWPATCALWLFMSPLMSTFGKQSQLKHRLRPQCKSVVRASRTSYSAHVTLALPMCSMCNHSGRLYWHSLVYLLFYAVCSVDFRVMTTATVYCSLESSILLIYSDCNDAKSLSVRQSASFDEHVRVRTCE